MNASVLITNMAPNDATDGAHQEGQREERKGQNKRAAPFHFWEENARDNRGHIDIGRIIEPLNKRANECGLDGGYALFV